jgi:hypothetical protein
LMSTTYPSGCAALASRCASERVTQTRPGVVAG